MLWLSYKCKTPGAGLVEELEIIYIDVLLWDDENVIKIAAHQLTVNEVYQALVLDTDREAAWVKDDEHGRRLMVIGTCEFHNKTIIAYLDTVDEAEGIWRPRTAWRLEK